MGFFSDTVKAYAEGRHPVAALLFEHDLHDGTHYNWTGAAYVRINGHVYIGKGELVKVGPMPFGADDSAQPLSITLSGVLKSHVIEARTMPPVRGSPQRVYLQFFHPETLQPIDPPYLVAERTLDNMTYSRAGSTDYRVTATSEDIWTSKNTSQRANYSDDDQQADFPGDRGLEFVAELVAGTRVKWPDFTNSE